MTFALLLMNKPTLVIAVSGMSLIVAGAAASGLAFHESG
jgi:hypothetical protein